MSHHDKVYILIGSVLPYMSRVNAIKVFRDLLAFLTVIPLGKTEDFVETSARNMWLFPFVGGLMGLIAAGYFSASRFILSYVLQLANFLVHIPTSLLLGILPPAMTIAFLLVFTGFQHFDGLVDLGNALGLRRIEERREMAHRWVVTYKGALLALFVEFSAIAGLFFLSWNIAVRAVVVGEVCAKLAMVTIVWRGKAAHQGLGARFIGSAKRKANVVAYVGALIMAFALLGLVGIIAVLVAAVFGVFMDVVANSMFGGVSGDIIGATNEASRALSLVSIAAFSVLVSGLLWGGLFL